MENFNIENLIPQLSIDCVIFGYSNRELKVLVSKFSLGQDIWTLPGGFIQQTETIEEAAINILKVRTGLENIYLEQYRVFGGQNRVNTLHKSLLEDNTTSLIFSDVAVEWLSKRFVSIGYYALVDIGKVNPQKGVFDEQIEWRNIDTLPRMIIDHNEMVRAALETLRQNLDQKLIGFNLLPDVFTMREVQELYEAVYDKAFARNNFQKKILDLNVLERLEKKFTGAANKAPFLYRFKKDDE